MAIIKSFVLQVVDSSNALVANLGSCVFPALQWLSNMGSRQINIDTDNYTYFSPYTPDYALIGNSVSDYFSLDPVSALDPTIPFSRLYVLAPLTLRKESIQYAGYKLRLAGNDSGYYAISNGTISAQGMVSGTWNLYDADGNLLGTQDSSIGFPLCDSVGVRCYMPHDISNGTVTSTVASILTISFGNSSTHYASARIYGTTPSTAFVIWFNALTQQTEPTDDPYDNLPIPGGDPLPGGGAVGIPGFPGLTATSAGVIGLFAPTAAQMQQLADFMWTDFGGTGTTVEEILQEVVEALKRTISNPLDYIIGLNIIPSQGLSIGGTKVVRFGFISSGVSMPQLANQYFTVDCGALSFDTVCGDTFLDYAPYSKFSIYLPYIGFKDVDPNDFVGHTIGVVYHGDCVTGGVTAYITKDGTVMYQYSGCCALNVPLSADNWGETISAAINVATGIVAAAASGGAAGLAQGALKGAASVAANPSLLSPQVSHSGAVSGGAGCMGVQFPFVIREAVNFHSTAGFNKSTGYPAYYYKKLGDVSGFTTVIDAHLSGIPMATQDEIAEIESLLESGVIL